MRGAGLGGSGTWERALGALYGLAIGDALGMPTEALTRAEVARRYGAVTGFLPGAAAVAAAVSGGVDGAGWAQSYRLAITAAELAADRGFPPVGDAVVHRLRHLPDTLDAIADGGLSMATQESVPAAFALAALAPDDPWRAARLAANLGGDSDTIGALAAGMLGAHSGVGALPADARQTVRRVNALDLEGLAAGLLDVRAAGA